jgi:CubicO group peptidase (beta-lactamase class C family)
MVSQKQIDTGNPNAWSSGYSFQFWIIPGQPGAFRCDGLYGQYSLILPKDNAVVAIQSNEQNDVLKIIPLMLKYLIS